MEKKYYTLEEANALVPTLELKIQGVVRIKKEISDIVTALLQKGIDVEKLFAMDRDTLEEHSLPGTKKRLAELGVALNEAVADIQNLGCLVKDMDLGLVDFYSLVEGAEIFYCWQLGEQEVRYWHGVNEGFSNRKPIYEEDEQKGEEEKWYH